LAEQLGCPVASTPRAKGIFPERHPLSVGPFGFAGSRLAHKAVATDADVLLVVGSRMGELSSGGWTSQLATKRIVQLDLVPEAIGANYPIEVGLVGDARSSLEALSGLLERPRPDAPSWCLSPAARWLEDEDLDRPPAAPVDPRRVLSVVRQVLPANGHLFCDIGNSMCWAVRHMVMDRPGQFHVNLTYGCMGHALPAAIGAVISGADPVLSLVGDSAFGMTASEIAVAVEGELPGPVWLVLDNGGNGMCHVGFKVGCGGRAPSALFGRPVGVADIAQAHGAMVFPVARSSDLERQLRAAIASRRPALVHIPVDPEAMPPMGGRLEALSCVVSPEGQS
jgi:acetolactate synthase-1/2/3 large subunit